MKYRNRQRIAVVPLMTAVLSGAFVAAVQIAPSYARTPPVAEPMKRNVRTGRGAVYARPRRAHVKNAVHFRGKPDGLHPGGYRIVRLEYRF